MPKIAENVKSLRKGKGLTIVELSKLSGVSATTICSYESGDKDDNYRELTIGKLAKALGCDYDDLVR